MSDDNNIEDSNNNPATSEQPVANPASAQPAAPQPEESASVQPELSPLANAYFAGFWARAAAWLIDAIILYIIFWLVETATGLKMTSEEYVSDEIDILTLVLAAGYFTITTGSKMQASPGKYILGMRVIRTDGNDVSYLLSLGRYFATILSMLTFFIGYIMAGLTKEKTALHDLVANTRVVFKGSMGQNVAQQPVQANQPAQPANSSTNNSTKIIITIILVIFLGIPMLGILSAIAIPQYYNYIKEAKENCHQDPECNKTLEPIEYKEF